MKKILLLSLVMYHFISFDQVFYKDSGDDGFKNLIANGIQYIKTTDTLFDASVINALEEVWTVTKFEVLENGVRPDPNKSILMRSIISEYVGSTTEKANVLIIIPANLEGSEISKYKTLAYAFFNGFKPKLPRTSGHIYAGLLVGAIHSGIERIYEDKISGTGAGFYLSVCNAFNKKSQGITNKRLIIHSQKADHCLTKKMDALGMNYKFVDDAGLEEVVIAKNENDYILHFAYNSYTEISVLSAVDGQILFTRHYASACSKLKGSDLKTVSLYF